MALRPRRLAVPEPAVSLALLGLALWHLFPDFTPVLGYLDDLLIVALGVALAVRLIPRLSWRASAIRVHCGQTDPEAM